VRTPTTEDEPNTEAFLAALRDLGYVKGGNLIFDVRDVDRNLAGVAAAVDELIALKPDLLLGWESIAQLMRARTSSIPIVLTGAINPVKAGLAHSLRRPGMNVTGVAQLNDLLPAKHIELMREISPGLKRVGLFVDTTAPGCRLVEEGAREAARVSGVALTAYYVANRDDIQRAFSQMNRQRPGMLMPCPSAVLYNARDLLFDSAAQLGIPFTSFIVANVPAGVLFAYAASIHEDQRRIALYVDKILRGARPADLPIEQPTKFQLVINLKTARAIGMTVPPSVLLRADQVIE
jgi:putative ABC transport system substrate-binding protein